MLKDAKIKQYNEETSKKRLSRGKLCHRRDTGIQWGGSKQCEVWLNSKQIAQPTKLRDGMGVSKVQRSVKDIVAILNVKWRQILSAVRERRDGWKKRRDVWGLWGRKLENWPQRTNWGNSRGQYLKRSIPQCTYCRFLSFYRCASANRNSMQV